jgi:hypothetical protein
VYLGPFLSREDWGISDQRSDKIRRRGEHSRGFYPSMQVGSENQGVRGGFFFGMEDFLESFDQHR